MRKFWRLVLFGFVSWLLTFSLAIALSPLKQSHRPLFETLIGVVVAFSAVVCTLLYMRPVHVAFVREGVVLGLVLAVCNIAFDLPMFMTGPMQMPLADYLQDIGLAYLAMPVITIGIGYALARGGRRKL